MLINNTTMHTLLTATLTSSHGLGSTSSFKDLCIYPLEQPVAASNLAYGLETLILGPCLASYLKNSYMLHNIVLASVIFKLMLASNFCCTRWMSKQTVAQEQCLESHYHLGVIIGFLHLASKDWITVFSL